MDAERAAAVLEELAAEGSGTPVALLAFSGDFYYEPSDVCRGVALGQAEALGGEAGNPVGGAVDGASTLLAKGFVGDGYNEGLQWIDGHHGMSLLGDCHFAVAYDRCPMVGNDDDAAAGQSGPGVPAMAEWFAGGRRPPAVPAGGDFQLAATTIHATADEPAALGGRLRRLLSDVLAVTVAKASPQKFSVNFLAFEECGSCGMKLRIFQVGSREFAVELQRRSGDALAFHSAFRKATRFLGQQAAAARPPAAALPPLGGEAGGALSVATIAPLLDMAGWTELPSAQAECASLLSDLAQGDATAAPFYSAQTFASVKKLLLATDARVAYPTARLFLALARRPAIAPRFAEEGVIQIMLETIQTCWATTIVGEILALTLKTAIAHSVQVLPAGSVEDMLSTLVGRWGALQGCTVVASAHLSDALSILQARVH